jgi:hypothetical protein
MQLTYSKTLLEKADGIQKVTALAWTPNRWFKAPTCVLRHAAKQQLQQAQSCSCPLQWEVCSSDH